MWRRWLLNLFKSKGSRSLPDGRKLAQEYLQNNPNYKSLAGTDKDFEVSWAKYLRDRGIVDQPFPVNAINKHLSDEKVIDNTMNLMNKIKNSGMRKGGAIPGMRKGGGLKKDKNGRFYR